MTVTSWITTATLSSELDIHPRTLYRWAADSRFPKPRLINHRLYFQRDEIDAWKASATVKGVKVTL